MSRINFEYGKSQIATSNMMVRYPTLAKYYYSLFGYTNVGNFARALVVKKLLNKLPLSNFKKILDLGCGLGEFSFMIADQFPEISFTALDVDPDRIAKVDKAIDQAGYENIKSFCGPIQDLGKEEEFDFIFSVDVFEHILAEDMPFKECYIKLKRGGYLLVKIPNIIQSTFMPNRLFEAHNKWLEKEHIGQVYDLPGLEKRFLEAGFVIEFKSYSDGGLSRMAWEIGYFSKKGGVLTQTLFLPLCKAMIHLDNIFVFKKRGNAIQIIGRKI